MVKTKRQGRPPARDRRLSEILEGATRGETAKLLGISTAALDAQVRQGCPRRADGCFDVPVVAQWLRQRASETARANRGSKAGEEALTRWREMRAAREQLRLDQERGKLVEFEAVEERSIRQIVAVRQGLTDLRSKLPGRLEGLPADEIERELGEEFDNLCRSFAQGLEAAPAQPEPADAEPVARRGTTKTPQKRQRKTDR